MSLSGQTAPAFVQAMYNVLMQDPDVGPVFRQAETRQSADLALTGLSFAFGKRNAADMAVNGLHDTARYAMCQSCTATSSLKCRMIIESLLCMASTRSAERYAPSVRCVEATYQSCCSH
jgi:hypothetical protein